MIRKVVFSFVMLGLVTAGPIAAQEKPEELQIVEFDYDQQGLTVNLPSSVQAPEAAPADSVKAPEKAPEAAKADSTKANPGQSEARLILLTTQPDSATLPTPIKTTAPAKAVPDKKEPRLIVITGEPDSPAKAAPAKPAVAPPPADVDDATLLNDLFNPSPTTEEAVVLTLPGLGQGTTIPAAPGEARVEKSVPAKAAPAPKAAPPAPAPKAVSVAAPSAPALPPVVKTDSAPVTPVVVVVSKPQTAPAAPLAPAKVSPFNPHRRAVIDPRYGEVRPSKRVYQTSRRLKRSDFMKWELATGRWSRISPCSNIYEGCISGRTIYPASFRK